MNNSLNRLFKISYIRAIVCFCLLTFSIHSVSGQYNLDYYIQYAIKNSPVFIENKNLSNSLSLDSLLIRASAKPQVNLTSNDLFAPVVNGYGYDEIITNKGNYNALLGVNVPVIGKKNRDTQFNSLAIQNKMLALNSKLSERDLKQAVTAQYITVFGEQQILSNINIVLTKLKQEDVILKKFTEKGIYHQTDYLSFLVNYNQQQIVFDQQQLQMHNDLYLLNYSCGIIDTTIVILAEPVLKITDHSVFDETSSFNKFVLDSFTLQNSIEQLRYKYKPKLILLGDAGYNSSLQFHPERNFGASVGLNLSIPVFDGNQRNLQLKKFKLTENSRISRIEFNRKQFSMQQIQLRYQITETESLIIKSKDQLHITETLLNANSQLLEKGEIKVVDYILSFTNFLSSQATIQQLNSNKMLLINQFNYLNY